MGIKAADNFFDSLENFLGIISYYAGCFMAIILIEHCFFRYNTCTKYDRNAWNDQTKLPTGIAALGASLISLALIVPCIDSLWYVGPIAKKTGDLGFEAAFAVTAIFYFPLRSLELSYWRRL